MKALEVDELSSAGSYMRDKCQSNWISRLALSSGLPVNDLPAGPLFKPNGNKKWKKNGFVF